MGTESGVVQIGSVKRTPITGPIGAKQATLQGTASHVAKLVRQSGGKCMSCGEELINGQFGLVRTKRQWINEFRARAFMVDGLTCRSCWESLYQNWIPDPLHPSAGHLVPNGIHQFLCCKHAVWWERQRKHACQGWAASLESGVERHKRLGLGRQMRRNRKAEVERRGDKVLEAEAEGSAWGEGQKPQEWDQWNFEATSGSDGLLTSLD